MYSPDWGRREQRNTYIYFRYRMLPLGHTDLCIMFARLKSPLEGHKSCAGKNRPLSSIQIGLISYIL